MEGNHHARSPGKREGGERKKKGEIARVSVEYQWKLGVKCEKPLRPTGDVMREGRPSCIFLGLGCVKR